MKKPLVIAVALLVSATAFGQKKELREVEKLIKKGDLAGAKTMLSQVKSIASSGDFAAQYYFLEGTVGLENAKKNANLLASLKDASQAFAKVREIEGGKGKFTAQLPALSEVAAKIASNKGQEAYTKQDFKTATTAFEQVYRFSPRDTVNLYYAASMAVQDKDYDLALQYYKELKNMNYDGSEVLYYAKDKQSGEEQLFGSKNQRDLMVKGGTHTNPRTEKTPSKRAEIVKNIAYIYVEQGKNDEALQAFEEARKRFPNDANIVVQEAMIYFQLDNKDKFKELMQEAIRIEPNNPDLHYNIGVINLQQNNVVEARKSFEEALRLKPDYAAAALNISTSYITEGNALIEEMNALGNSKADVKKYEELRVKKDDFFKKGADVLEDYVKKQGNTKDILEQLKSIYGALGDHSNFQRIKSLLGE
ncbi:tetratricopeptide repeat protein [Capnocytophaga canis]|uniref:tetratricopeptide repeat protein n=1 Tax=Capnocytophaga canis TaxID=1848903 RepID=UPI0037CF88A0